MRYHQIQLLLLMMPAVLRAQEPWTGGYVVRLGTTEIVRERYAFDGRELRSTLAVPAQRLLIDGTTRYDTLLSPVRYVASARLVGDTVPFQRLTAEFTDSVAWEVTGRNPQVGGSALARPYGVFRNLAFSHLAVTMLRYDRGRGGSQRFALWVPDGGVTVPLTIQLAGDSGTVEIRGVAMQVTLMRQGWLKRVVIPAQNVVVEWQEAMEFSDEDVGPPPRPTAPPGVIESRFTFSSGALVFDATLAVPAGAAGRWPAAVIVAGSGPTDRDGNSPAGARTNMYAQLAWRLAERGIASLRYDKRGLGATQGAFDPSEVTLQDFADDAGAAVRTLAADERFSPVVIVGHSEGAALALVAANAGAPADGVVLLAGAGRPLIGVLREQLADQLDSATLAAFDGAMPRYLEGEEVPDVPAALRPFFRPVNRRFLQTAAAFEPTAAIARLEAPVLIVQGGTDVQISLRDAELLAEARPEATLVVLPDMNHVLKRAAVRGRASQVRQYADPSLPIVSELVDTIVEWVLGLDHGGE